MDISNVIENVIQSLSKLLVLSSYYTFEHKLCNFHIRIIYYNCLPNTFCRNLKVNRLINLSVFDEKNILNAVSVLGFTDSSG